MFNFSAAPQPPLFMSRAPYLDPDIPWLLAEPSVRRRAPEHRAQVLLEAWFIRPEQARRRVRKREHRRHDLVLAPLDDGAGGYRDPRRSGVASAEEHGLVGHRGVVSRPFARRPDAAAGLARGTQVATDKPVYRSPRRSGQRQRVLARDALMCGGVHQHAAAAGLKDITDGPPDYRP